MAGITDQFIFQSAVLILRINGRLPNFWNLSDLCLVLLLYLKDLQDIVVMIKPAGYFIEHMLAPSRCVENFSILANKIFINAFIFFSFLLKYLTDGIQDCKALVFLFRKFHCHFGI